MSHTETILDGMGRDRPLIGAPDCRIDGFTITRGRFRGHGGALIIEDVDMVVTNNVFVDNSTLKPGDFRPVRLAQRAHRGGAIASLNKAAPTIEHNLFLQNSTEIGNGGAIAFLYNSERADDKRPRVAYNVFVENASGRVDPRTRSSNGGAIAPPR